MWRGERDGGGESFVHPVAVETTLKPNPRRKSHEIKVLELLNQAVGMGEECLNFLDRACTVQRPAYTRPLLDSI